MIKITVIGSAVLTLVILDKKEKITVNHNVLKIVIGGYVIKEGIKPTLNLLNKFI